MLPHYLSLVGTSAPSDIPEPSSHALQHHRFDFSPLFPEDGRRKVQDTHNRTHASRHKLSLHQEDRAMSGMLQKADGRAKLA